MTSPAIVRSVPGREAGRPSGRRPHWPRWSRKTRRDLRLGLLFISPWLVGFAAFYLYPAIASLYYSFTDFRILQAPTWVGLDNYTKMLADPQFWKALGNTLYITILGVPLAVMTALAIALLLNVKKIVRKTPIPAIFLTFSNSAIPSAVITANGTPRIVM